MENQSYLLFKSKKYKHNNMNILAYRASRFIKIIQKHKLQPNESTLAKGKEYDLEQYFEKKTDAGKLVLYIFMTPCCSLEILNAPLICQVSVNIIIHKTIWKPMQIGKTTKYNNFIIFFFFRFLQALDLCYML